MRIRNKIKASAIQYALVLTVVIALLLGGLILFSGASRSIETQFHIQEKLRFNAISGIEYGKAFMEELALNEPKQLVLFDGGIDSVAVTKKNWGGYTILVSDAYHGNNSFQKMAMVGHLPDHESKSLVLADLGSPLSVCGRTVIKGHCELPKRGIKRAYIAGQNYIGDKLLYGTKSTSQSHLPAIDQPFLNQINQPVLVEKQEWELVDSLVVSFSESPKYFYSAGPVSVSDCVLKGQIIIESGDSIFVGGNSKLENVILKSPVIYFETGFEGDVQVFSSHKITTEPNVTFRYPSVMGLIETERREKASILKLGEGTILLGSLFVTSDTPDFRKEVRLDISKSSYVAGLTYCNGKTQLNGKVNGQILTKKFYLKTASSTYENHLLNAEIVNDLPEGFATIPLLNRPEKYKTLAWLK